jgi:hypothetical protein
MPWVLIIVFLSPAAATVAIPFSTAQYCEAARDRALSNLHTSYAICVKTSDEKL